MRGVEDHVVGEEIRQRDIARTRADFDGRRIFSRSDRDEADAVEDDVRFRARGGAHVQRFHAGVALDDFRLVNRGALKGSAIKEREFNAFAETGAGVE